MLKDPESKKYIHRFIDSSKKGCQICGQAYEEHSEINYHHHNANDEDVSLTMPDGMKPQNLNEGVVNTNRRDNRQSIGTKMIIKTSNIKIEIPKQLMEEFEDPHICRICFDKKLDVDPKVSFSCSHEFCKQCVNNYLTTNIINGNVIQIKCLYGGCPRVFTNEEVKINVDEIVWNKYRKFLIQKFKLNNSDQLQMNCPFPNCEEIVAIDPLEKQIFVECEQDHKFCSKCKEVGWHEDGRCEKVNFILLLLK